MEQLSDPVEHQLRWLLPVVIGLTAVTLAGVGGLMMGRPFEVLWARWVVHNAPIALALLWGARMLLGRWPHHRVGWLLLATGSLLALHVGSVSLADRGLVTAGVLDVEPVVVPAELALITSVPLWLSAFLWIPSITLSLMLLLVLPDGRLPSPRWRWAPVVASAGTVVFASAYVIEVWPRSQVSVQAYQQAGNLPLTRTLMAVGGGLLAAAAVASVAAPVSRWRAGSPAERQQIRAVAIAGTVMGVAFVALFPWQAIWVPVSLLATYVFFGTYVLAVTRYRLHDLDVVISRAVVGTVLAVLVTLLYLAIVVGAGALIGRGSQRTWLPLLAVGVTAVLFDPVRRRVQFLVERLLYGHEQDPSRVLSVLAGRLRDAMSGEEILDRAVTLLRQSTGAVRAEVAVDVDGVGRLAASSGPLDGPSEVAVVLAVDVVHRGARLGEVRLLARGVSDLVQDAEQVLSDVAGTLGVVLANVRLTSQLEAQVAELRRSRERLVDAHHEGRRTLERDLHDGAQARLVALRINLGLAAAMASHEASAELHARLVELEQQVDEVVRSLRSLARGLQPPVLVSSGVGAALREEVRELPLRVRIDDRWRRRHAPLLEAAVYFVCLEAVQNAAKHADASEVRVELVEADGSLRFRVEDDGRGFDASTSAAGTGLTHLTDRIEALEGQLTVTSARGRGCLVEGVVPNGDTRSDALARALATDG